MPVEVGRGRKGGDPHAGGKRGRDGEEVLVMPIYGILDNPKLPNIITGAVVHARIRHCCTHNNIQFVFFVLFLCFQSFMGILIVHIMHVAKMWYCQTTDNHCIITHGTLHIITSSAYWLDMIQCSCSFIVHYLYYQRKEFFVSL